MTAYSIKAAAQSDGCLQRVFINHLYEARTIKHECCTRVHNLTGLTRLLTADLRVPEDSSPKVASFRRRCALLAQTQTNYRGTRNLPGQAPMGARFDVAWNCRWTAAERRTWRSTQQQSCNCFAVQQFFRVLAGCSLTTCVASPVL